MGRKNTRYAPEGGKYRLAENLFDAYRFKISCDYCEGMRGKPGFIKDAAGKPDKDSDTRRYWKCQRSNANSSTIRSGCRKLPCSAFILKAKHDLSTQAFATVLDKTLKFFRENSEHAIADALEAEYGDDDSSVRSVHLPSHATTPNGPTPVSACEPMVGLKRKANDPPSDLPSKRSIFAQFVVGAETDAGVKSMDVANGTHARQSKTEPTPSHRVGPGPSVPPTAARIAPQAMSESVVDPLDLYCVQGVDLETDVDAVDALAGSSARDDDGEANSAVLLSPSPLPRAGTVNASPLALENYVERYERSTRPDLQFGPEPRTTPVESSASDGKLHEVQRSSPGLPSIVVAEPGATARGANALLCTRGTTQAGDTRSSLDKARELYRRTRWPTSKAVMPQSTATDTTKSTGYRQPGAAAFLAGASTTAGTSDERSPIVIIPRFQFEDNLAREPSGRQTQQQLESFWPVNGSKVPRSVRREFQKMAKNGGVIEEYGEVLNELREASRTGPNRSTRRRRKRREVKPQYPLGTPTLDLVSSAALFDDEQSVSKDVTAVPKAHEPNPALQEAQPPVGAVDHSCCDSSDEAVWRDIDMEAT